MRVIIPLLILGIVFAAGYIAGMYTRPKAGPKLTRPERKELAELRELKTVARTTAAQHTDVYPELARIVQDEDERTDRKIDKIRADS